MSSQLCHHGTKTAMDNTGIVTTTSKGSSAWAGMFVLCAGDRAVPCHAVLCRAVLGYAVTAVINGGGGGRGWVFTFAQILNYISWL